MTTEPQVTHPPVTHPETITLKVAQERPRKPSDGSASERTARRRRPLPPPKTIAAVALVVAALELLIWQVGGVFWGVVIHVALIVLFLLPTGVLLFLAWRKARGARRGGTPADRKTTTTSTTHGAGPLRRLFGPVRGKSGPSGGSPAGGRQRKPGLLSKLFPGRAGRSPKGGPDRPTGGRRGPLGKLFGPGRRSSPKGGGRSGPGGGRSPKGSLFRNPFRSGKSASGHPSGSNRTGRSPKGKKGHFWPDLIKGFKEGAKPKAKPADKVETIAGKRKPSPGPSAAKPAPVQKVRPTEPKHANEEMVREAVQKAADATPAPVTTPRHTGGSYVGDMNKIRAAADELAAALKDYDPENMHQMVREMPGLEEALANVSSGFRHLGSRAESEWPVAAPVAEALRSIADDIKAGAGTAGEARNTVRNWNETDIERGEAPRHGSRHIESKWDVRDAE